MPMINAFFIIFLLVTRGILTGKRPPVPRLELRPGKFEKEHYGGAQVIPIKSRSNLP
jgi:hypothetical protein